MGISIGDSQWYSPETLSVIHRKRGVGEFYELEALATGLIRPTTIHRKHGVSLERGRKLCKYTGNVVSL